VKIIGKITDSVSGEPLAFAGVFVADSSGNPTGTGTTTAIDGSYELDGVTPDSLIGVQFVGYPRTIFKVRECSGQRCDFKMSTTGVDLNVFEKVALSKKTITIMIISGIALITAAYFTYKQFKR
jgi:hypothetical protein